MEHEGGVDRGLSRDAADGGAVVAVRRERLAGRLEDLIAC
jgi:hypothetical protein